MAFYPAKFSISVCLWGQSVLFSTAKYFVYLCTMKAYFLILFLACTAAVSAQENPLNNPVQSQTQLKVTELVQKKAEYHRLTNGVQDGYRIKLHFGVERASAEALKEKFSARFPEIACNLDYQQPNFVVLAGDFKTRLEAFESLKKIQTEFPNAFIVRGKVNLK